MDKGNIDILLITQGEPGNRGAATNIDKLLKILLDMTLDIHLITYCDRDFFPNLSDERISSLAQRGTEFRQFVSGQLSVSKKMLSLYRRNRIRIIMLAFGQDLLILPLALSKIAGVKVIIRSDGRPSTVLARYFKSHVFRRYLFKAIEEINYRLADAVLTESEYMVLDRCQIADIIDGQVGLVVPYDKSQLSDAILRMLTDDKIRQQFGEKGKALVREKFDWSKIVEQLEDIYRTVLIKTT